MKGLIFSETMVKSWLAGRKSVTRRLMRSQPDTIRLGNAYKDPVRINPPYLPGETVYIKETWALLDCDFCPIKPPYTQNQEYGYIVYKADHITGNDGPEKIHWQSPRFMPERAARGHARIISVRPVKEDGIWFWIIELERIDQ